MKIKFLHKRDTFFYQLFKRDTFTNKKKKKPQYNNIYPKDNILLVGISCFF